MASPRTPRKEEVTETSLVNSNDHSSDNINKIDLLLDSDSEDNSFAQSSESESESDAEEGVEIHFDSSKSESESNEDECELTLENQDLILSALEDKIVSEDANAIISGYKKSDLTAALLETAEETDESDNLDFEPSESHSSDLSSESNELENTDESESSDNLDYEPSECDTTSSCTSNNEETTSSCQSDSHADSSTSEDDEENRSSCESDSSSLESSCQEDAEDEDDSENEEENDQVVDLSQTSIKIKHLHIQPVFVYNNNNNFFFANKHNRAIEDAIKKELGQNFGMTKKH